jgi:hypothetical protein
LAGSSLAQFLNKHRGVRNVRKLGILTEALILKWARQHHEATGHWPTENSGPVIGQKGEVWSNINAALREGGRSLRGGTTLAKLLAEKLGIRNRASIPDLTIEQILSWADAYKAMTGSWPRVKSGAIVGVADETWMAVEAALNNGCRGLAAGSSLARLLAQHRGVRNKARLPFLSPEQILAWAEAHYKRYRRWAELRERRGRGCSW